MKTVASLILCIVFAAFGSHALAKTRDIPVSAKAITVSPYTSRSLVVDGKEVFLTAGARIYSAQNRTIVPSRVPAKAKARAVFERDGKMSEVWLLTPDEIAASKN